MGKEQYITKNEFFTMIRTESKNHGKMPFKPTPKQGTRKLDGESKLRLHFNDKELVKYSDDRNITWIVSIADKTRPLTMRAIIMLDGTTRVVGVDPNGVPISYRYDDSTRTKSAYHMNVISFDQYGQLINVHDDLPIYEYFSNIYKFAEYVADLWNITIWSDEAEDWFYDQL